METDKIVEEAKKELEAEQLRKAIEKKKEELKQPVAPVFCSDCKYFLNKTDNVFDCLTYKEYENSYDKRKPIREKGYVKNRYNNCPDYKPTLLRRLKCLM